MEHISNPKSMIDETQPILFDASKDEYKTNRTPNPGKCDICGVKDGLTIVRSHIDPSKYLIFVDNDYHTTKSGQPIKFSEIPSMFDITEEYTEVNLVERSTLLGYQWLCPHCRV